MPTSDGSPTIPVGHAAILHTWTPEDRLALLTAAVIFRQAVIGQEISDEAAVARAKEILAKISVTATSDP